MGYNGACDVLRWRWVCVCPSLVIEVVQWGPSYLVSLGVVVYCLYLADIGHYSKNKHCTYFRQRGESIRLMELVWVVIMEDCPHHNLNLYDILGTSDDCWYLQGRITRRKRVMNYTIILERINEFA